MRVAAYDEARAQLSRQERLLLAIDLFFREQEKATGSRWSDATFSVKAKSSTLMDALRAGRFVGADVCDAAERVMKTEREKWTAPKRKRRA